MFVNLSLLQHKISGCATRENELFENPFEESRFYIYFTITRDSFYTILCTSMPRFHSTITYSFIFDRCSPTYAMSFSGAAMCGQLPPVLSSATFWFLMTAWGALSDFSRKAQSRH